MQWLCRWWRWREMGKSSSQVTGYRYFAKFAAFIGNRIEKLIGINFDNRGWIVKDENADPSIFLVDKPYLYGENEGGVFGDIDIHIGIPDQQPNSEYQEYFPLVSGYPYQSYLVFRGSPSAAFWSPAYRQGGFYLGNSGYMKEMLLWVKRIHVKNDGDVQWYDGKSEVIDPSKYIEYENSEETIEGVVIHEKHSLEASHEGDYSNNLVFQANRVIEDDIEYIFTAFHRIYAKHTDFSWEYGKSVNQFVLIHPFSSPKKLKLRIFSFGEPDIRIGVPPEFILSQKDIFPPLNVTGVSWYKQRDIEILILADMYVPIHLTLNNAVDTWAANLIMARFEFMFADGVGRVGRVGDDINPIHKIREILTDDTAMSKPESDVNDANFMKAADRIYDEGLGISWAVDEKSCIDAIEELCYHIEAGIRVNRQTGLYEMILFRDDWFAKDEIHDIAENKIKDLSLEVMNSDDIVNQLNVTYYDRQRIKNSTFSIYENGSILTMGHANAESVEFPYFMNMRNAEIVANWKLKQFSTPAWSGSFTTGWKEARKWNRYDLIRLPWSSKWNGTILVRIMKINLGNGTDNTVTIDFEEVIPYSGEMNTSIVVDAPAESAPQPPQPSTNAVFEAPYYLTVLRVGQTNADLELSTNPDIGCVAAVAAKPQNNSLNALLFTDGGMGEFEQVSRLDYCDILQLDQPIIETTSSFTVAGSLTQVANSNNLILLNDELIGFVSFDNETKVLTVKRGVLDTVPKKHSSGSLFVFDLPDVAFDSTQYSQSEIVEAQVLTTTPSGIQELSETGQAIEIKARAIRPYPPANVKINDEYFPAEIETDLIITWVDRNRVQQTGGTPLSWFDNGVAIEQNTQTRLILMQLDENDLEVATTNANVTGSTSYTMPISSMQANARFVKIILKTVRDGYECLNPFVHKIELSQFFSAPYELTVEFKND